MPHAREIVSHIVGNFVLTLRVMSRLVLVRMTRAVLPAAGAEITRYPL